MSVFDKNKSRRSFDRAAVHYDQNAQLQQMVATNLLRHLEGFAQGLAPHLILDLGCGTGQVAEAMQLRYPDADITALDFSKQMLVQTEQRLSKQGLRALSVCADAEQLPFKEASFDLIVSSLMLQWANNLEKTLRDIQRSLSSEGILAFSSLSEGTLKEVKASWEAVDQSVHSSNFQSLDSFERIASAAGYSNISVISETIVINYSSVREMLLEMKGIGASNASNERFKGLTGKQRFEAFERAFESFRLTDGAFPCTWEVTYVFCAK